MGISKQELRQYSSGCELGDVLRQLTPNALHEKCAGMISKHHGSYPRVFLKIRSIFILSLTFVSYGIPIAIQTDARTHLIHTCIAFRPQGKGHYQETSGLHCACTVTKGFTQVTRSRSL